jgi:GT2 family glycosyltransferase
MTDSHVSPTVRTQVVLYENEPAAMTRLVDAVAAAAAVARREGLVDTVDLALGDCSPAPVLAADDAEALAARFDGDGAGSCTYEFFDANLGSAGGSNRLARSGSGDLLLVLNPDTYPSPRLLADLVPVMDDPRVGAVDARQIPLEHPKDFDDRTGETSWASGACMLVRREAFDRVGGFDDEHFFLYCDDVDLSWRIRHAGYRVLHAPGAVVFHDKVLDHNGRVAPAATEPYYGVLGRLMLAHRFERPDIVEQTIESVEAGGDGGQQLALAEYRRRGDEGRLPDPLAGGADVAQFVDGEYARHRF